jgi:hypothetical protein
MAPSQGLRDRRIIPFLAKRNTEDRSGLGAGAGLSNYTLATASRLRRRYRFTNAKLAHIR